MKISIKYKSSLFITLFLLSVLGLMSYLILDGIAIYLENERENFFVAQSKNAERLLIKEFNSNFQNVSESEYFEGNVKGNLPLISQQSGMKTCFYNTSYKMIGSNIPQSDVIDFTKYLKNVSESKSACISSKNSIFYISMLKGDTEKLGFAVFQYVVSKDIKFYEDIKSKLLQIGGTVFIGSLVVVLLYFNRFVTIIFKLKKHIESISSQKYDILPIKRNDELGELSSGIYNMGNKIKTNIDNINTEKNNLNLAVEKLQKLSNQQKDFIGNFTHEFKSPLTTIKAFNDLVGMYKDDPKFIDDAVSNIQKECDRLIDMVEKILKLKTLEKYSFEYTMKSVRLKPLLEDVINRMYGKAQKYNILMTYRIDDVVILAEDDSLIQIFVNMIDNAIKYNVNKGKISINTFEDKGFINFRISDTGAGIPKEYWQRIFEPFFIVNREESKKAGSTGLGLAIVKEMVEKQGGTIEVETSSSSGTSFLIKFPSLHGFP